ncbi:MAG: hypothetical protein O2971_03705 [Proteobacteria bacterium]|nr:hypothetical protein [Pseudomonadota bacterium]
MAIYELAENELIKIRSTTFSEQGIRERQDLQRLLRAQIEVIAPNTLVVGEEFGDWADSRRRIDLLGIDKDANLVVIELKRSEDGGHMELQAIRYAAMIANLTFSKVVDIYEGYLKSIGTEANAEENLLEFLELEEPDEESFGNDVRIILAAAEFSKEVTSAVLWLNEKSVDIRCIRIRPYQDGNKTLLDVQTVIPLPETEQYQVQLNEKKQEVKKVRSSNIDTTRFDLAIGQEVHRNLPKRHLMYRTVKAAIESGIAPEAVAEFVPGRKNRMFKIFDGELDETALSIELCKDDPHAERPRTKRYFCKEGEMFFIDGKTYVLSNQWGRGVPKVVQSMIDAFPALKMKFSPTDTESF